jgi:DNA-binding PadR family transcriptional regulator
LLVSRHTVESQTDIGFVIIGRKVMWMQEFQRAAVRLHILHHAAEGEVHGAWLTKELSRHGYEVSPGTLYPTLHRLEADGLLVSKHRVVGGRVRRVYRATRAGRAALTEDRRALRELAKEVLGNRT